MSPALDLRLSGCPQSWHRPLRELIELEISSLQVERGLGDLERPKWVELRCYSGGLTVVVATARERRSRELPAESGGVDAAWRTVALVAAELTIGQSAPPEPRVAPVVQPEPPLDSEPTPRGLSVFTIGGIVRYWGEPAAPGFGVNLGYEGWAPEGLGLRLDFTASRLVSDVALGSVEALSASAGAFLLVGVDARPWYLSLGLGGRVGGARLTGHPSDDMAEGGRLTGAFGGPALLVSSRYALSSKVGLFGAVEGGYVTLPIRGVVEENQDPVFGLQKFWVQVALGFSVPF
jgi:hypothetical protein